MNKLFGNIIVVAIVTAIWCAASTVYHAQLPYQHIAYFGMLMTPAEVIATVWSAWALLTATALIISHAYTWVSRQERILNTPLAREPQVLVATSTGLVGMPLRLAEEIGAPVLATY